MFETRALTYKEQLVIPQSYHGAMAASLVEQWGNTLFERPQHIESVVEAAASHHLGAFGFIDSIKVNGQFSPRELAQLFAEESEVQTADPKVKAHVLYHNLRVMNGLLMNGSADNAGLREVYDHTLRMFHHELSSSELTMDQLRFADGILCLTDKVSFDFCNQNYKPRTVIMKPTQDSDATEVHYQINPDRTIRFDPWPFQNPQIDGMVQAYTKTGYPSTLNSRRIPYSVRQGTISSPINQATSICTTG